MKSSKPPNKTGQRMPVNFSLWLTGEAQRQMDRAIVLIAESEPDAGLLTRSELVRLAVRRLLLALLGERARPDAEGDPLMKEYLAILDGEPARPETPRPGAVVVPARPVEPAGNPGRAGKRKGAKR